VLLLPSYISHPGEFSDVIVDFVQSQNIDMIVPSSDSTLVALAENYERFTSIAHVACPHHHIVKRVVNKPKTFEIAKHLGLPLPHQYIVNSFSELIRLKDTLRFPLVVKGRDKSNMGRIRFRQNFKVYFCRNFKEIELLFSEKKFATHHIIQEYCTGDDVAIGMLMHKGKPLAIMQDRRLRQIHGRSILAVTEDVDPELAEWSVKLLRALEWEGIAMVEFKQDRSKRKVKFLEVNGRYWGTIPLSVHAGVDFPFYEWQLAHGQMPSVPSSYKPGIRTRWIVGDMQRLFKVFQEPERVAVPRPSRWKELFRFFGDFKLSTRIVLWDVRDPLPFFVELIQCLFRIFVDNSRSMVKRLLGK
jgi:predicted ATP-grasp superfamily ATP-dependent carboligase